MKRKLCSLLLALCMVLTMIPTAFAATTVASGDCGDNATWTLTDDGALTISGTGKMGNYHWNVVAPWNNYASDIKKATISNDITTIGNRAFYYCTNLTEITIPDSVTSIGELAFANCSALTEITIPAGVTSLERTFEDCTSLKKVNLPEGLTDIYGAFSGCSALKEINIPASVQHLGGAFSGCTSLTKVAIPEHLYDIGDMTFQGCSSLTDVNIPDEVSYIGNYIFEGCSALKKITIPNNVTEIGAGAFRGCSSLTEITIPENVTEIGGSPYGSKEESHTFSDCTALKKITFACELPYIADDCFVNTTATAYYPCGSDTWTESAVQTLAQENPTITWKVDHIQQTVPGKAPTCTTTGLTEGKACGCGEVVTVPQQSISVGHAGQKVAGKAATCTATGLTEGYVCRDCGKTLKEQQTIAKVAHKYENNICTVCGDKKVTVEGVGRVYGKSRYETAFQSADTLKKQMGVSKFSCAIVTSGDNFADALAGSYLAYVKNAPILLTDNDNIKDVMAYIQENVEKGATVYALGGKAVVTDKLLDLEKKGYDVKRLAGASRFETNLEILKECGSVAGKDILVCTGFNFADSLSASAAKRPILLVDDKLTSEQRAYLKQQSGCKYYIVGGTGAVTSSVEKSLKDYGTVKRLAGANRFETSVMVAETFFSKPTTAVLAYGYNFPDGLCAGPLAATINAPLILTATGDEAQAAAYAKEEGIKRGMVLGGPALINDKAVKKIFSMSSGDKIK